MSISTSTRAKFQTRSKRLVAFMVILLLSACQFPSASAISFLNRPTPTVETPDELVIYSTYDGYNKLPDFIAAFEEETGYKVNAESMTTDEIVRRLSEEQNSPKVDILFGVPGNVLIRLQTLGFLGNYSPANPEIKSRLENLSQRLRDNNSPPQWVGITAYATVFCINTIELNKLSQPLEPGAPRLIPTSWSSLVDPVYENEIILPNPTSSEIGYITLSTLIQLYTTRVPKAASLQQEAQVLGYSGEVGAWNLMQAIDKNVTFYEDSGGAACQRVADGDATIAVSYDAIAFDIQDKNRDRLLVLFPEEGFSLGMEGLAMVKKDQTHPAAILFMDWALSTEAMKVYEEYYALSSLRDSPLPYNANPLDEALPQRLAWESANRERLLNAWSEIYKDSVQTRRENRTPPDFDPASIPSQP